MLKPSFSVLEVEEAVTRSNAASCAASPDPTYVSLALCTGRGCLMAQTEPLVVPTELSKDALQSPTRSPTKIRLLTPEMIVSEEKCCRLLAVQTKVVGPTLQTVRPY